MIPLHDQHNPNASQTLCITITPNTNNRNPPAPRDKEVVYRAMHWCLQRLPQLKKRAYLARYLMPVEVPMEFMQDQALVDLHESYRQLQVRT